MKKVMKKTSTEEMLKGDKKEKRKNDQKKRKMSKQTNKSKIAITERNGKLMKRKS